MAVDAGAVDAAPSDSLTTGIIEVRMIGGTTTSPTPLAGGVVVFTDSVQTQVVLTDQDGRAFATVTGPTTITDVRFPTPTFVFARSVLDAEPGDVIEIRPRAWDFTELAPLTVHFTAPEPGYSVCGPCGCEWMSSSPATLPMKEMCRSNPAAVLVMNPTQTAYATATVAYDPTTGGVVTVPAQWTPSTQYSATYTNVDPRITSIGMAFADGQQSLTRLNMPSGTASGHVPSWRFQSPRFVTTFLNANGAGEHQVAVQTVAATSAGLSMDVGASLLPWLGKPVFDTASRSVAVPIVAAGAEGDLFMTQVGFTRPSGGWSVWQVFQARPKDFVLPAIPTSVADMTPELITGDPEAVMMASESVDGYAQARQAPYSLLYKFQTSDPGSVRVSFAPNSPVP